jgi:hypothetical protein
MAYPVASGNVSHSATLIPEIWAPKFLMKFYESTVLNEIANTDYEGEIKSQGDTVHINQIPDIEIVDHVKGQELDYERPQSQVIDLLIDKGKAYRFVCSDIDKKQSALNFMEKWTADAAKQMKIAIERAIYADIYSDADSANAGNSAGLLSQNIALGATGTPVQVTEANIVEYILRMGLALDEQDVPADERYCILPANMCKLLKDSDLKDASLAGDGKTSSLITGKIGMIDRFDIYNSNLLTLTTDGANTVANIIAGHKVALTFASQLVENEVIRAEKEFADYARGLQVYGYKVVKPTALVHGYAYV